MHIFFGAVFIICGALQRLAASGIHATTEETLRAIAERQATGPIAIAKTILLPGQAPAGNPP